MTSSNVSILERPVYAISEAAGLLGLRPDRARGWLDGYRRAGTDYPPVVRVEHTGEEIVTWGEFVELGYLREYRRKDVPLQRLRPVIEELRHEFGTPYPLATAKPFVYDKELVLELQERTELPAAIAIVIRSGQEILMTPETHRFFKKVEFDPTGSGDALRLRPAGAASPVVIDPLVSFGRPTVHGVATDRLWELHDAGETLPPVEKHAWLTHGVRGFVLTGRGSQSTADSKVILDRHWAEIEDLVASEEAGPWMRAVTANGLRSIDLR